MLTMPPDLPIEVVCHNDFAPYNVVFDGDRPVGVVDWETAAPGARVWDVAHAAYRFAPLSASAPPELRETRTQAVRLALFCNAYGLDRADRAILVATVARRASALRQLVAGLAAHSRSAAEASLWQGHADLYRDDESYLLASASALGDRL